MELDVKKQGFPRARQVTLKGVFTRVHLCIKAGAVFLEFFISLQQFLIAEPVSPKKSLRQALKFLQGVSTLVWYISSFHRQHFPSSYRVMQLFTYDKLYKHSPISSKYQSVLIVKFRDFLEYQWFQSGRNNE